MRQGLPAIACAVAILAAGPAAAGDLVAFGSRWETVDLGSTIGGGARVDLGSGLFGFRVSAAYYRWNPSSVDLGPGFADFELKAVPVELGLNVTLPLGRGVRAYASAGPAYYFLESTAASVSNRVGSYVAAGVKVATIDDIGWFVEADYHKATARLEGVVTTPGLDGRTRFDLGGFGVSAGLTLHF